MRRAFRVCLKNKSLDIRYQFGGMVVICYASAIIEYDRRTLELSSAPLHTKQEHHYYTDNRQFKHLII